VSEGLTVITQKANVACYKEVVARKHTIAPDSLARNPKPLKIQTVEGMRVLKDDTMEVDILRIEMPKHVDAMQLAYIPRDHLIVEADAYNMNSTVQPFARIMLDMVRRLNLTVDRVVPIHGTVSPWSDVEKSAQTAPTVATNRQRGLP
jgi:hypothetical protein